jgi:hypothetical protein
MIEPTMSRAALLGAWLVVLGPVATAEPAATGTPVPRTETADRREAFLQHVEAAFATRDPRAVAALADVETWRAAGYPELSTLEMFLPPAPIAFEKELTPLEVIYRDGNERKWRLVLTEVKGEFLAVVRATPCPRGVARAPQFEPEERPAPKVQAWTILECWPLPK